MANIAVSDRVRAWYRHPLVRIGSSIFGVGLGFLIVVFLYGRETVFLRTITWVGTIELGVGIALLSTAWAKTKPT